MVLSVIIVNYRVRYFLELCLHSLQKTLRGLEAEVFIVDNDSRDGSLEYLRPLFPWAQFLVNEENRGFGSANNQALEKARGKYILFLNPDTVLPEDFAIQCISFLESAFPELPFPESAPQMGERAHAEAVGKKGQMGAMGVRMVDGGGLFLKESLRGFPTPWVAFCKLTGLTALFPHTRLFATYYLGHLSPLAKQRAPVLSGACLWVSRAVLSETGGFDEQFFMYAEDIDLSYRIEKAGYRNYYFPDTTIVHFKGESTQKDIRYVKQFYKAMSQFRRKHFKGGFSMVFNAFMEVAIWLRAGITAVGRLFADKKERRLAENKESPTEEIPVVRTWLMGDPAGIQRLSTILSSLGRRVPAASAQQADEIIFCEGGAFSFKEAIAAMQTLGQGPEEGKTLRQKPPRFKFYAAGSGSVTGSASKEGRGETLLL